MPARSPNARLDPRQPRQARRDPTLQRPTLHVTCGCNFPEARPVSHGTGVARLFAHVRASHGGTPDAHRPGRPRGGGRFFFWRLSPQRGARSGYGPPCIDSSCHSPPRSTHVAFASDICSEVEGGRYHRHRDVTVACEPSSLVVTFTSSISVMFRSERSRARAARNWFLRSGTSSWATAADSPQRAFCS